MNEKGLNQVCNSGYASTTTKDRVCLSVAVWSRQAQVRTELGKQFVPSGMASLYNTLVFTSCRKDWCSYL